MGAMTDMSEASKVRQALDMNATAVKIALLFAVMWAGLFLWKRTSLDLWMLCMWLALGIAGMLVYRARKRKLKALDPD